MNLDSILLGLLSEPASGYDLGREFEESAALFWFAELSQIYPVLKRLERDGLLTSEEIPSTKGPPRKVYRRTAAGDEALARALRSEPHLARLRLPHVAQFYFLSELGDLDETGAFLDALETELRARLARFRAIEARIRECADGETTSDRGFHQYATLRAGILVAEARLAWCAETRTALDRRRGKGAGPVARGAADGKDAAAAEDVSTPEPSSGLAPASDAASRPGERSPASTIPRTR